MNNTYRQISKATSTIISLEEMKLYLRVDDSTDDTLITALITAAIKTAEKEMNRDLLTAVYENYRSEICQDLTLRKGGFLSVSGIQYLKDGTYEVMDTDDYTVANYGIYGRIWEVELDDYYDDNPEAIKIIFTAGFGASGTDIPDDIKTAIKAHVAYMYENRGDCLEDGNGLDIDSLLPLTSRVIYRNYKIVDLNGVF